MSSIDPNLGLNYGWTLGESGRGTGMDPNPQSPGGHDRRKETVLHPLHFQGRRSAVVWLEPELRRRGLLPGPLAPEHGMRPAPVRGSVGGQGVLGLRTLKHAACGCGACLLPGLGMTHTRGEPWHLRFASCPAHIVAGRQ